MNSIKLTFLGTGTSQGIPLIACDCIVCSSLDPKDNRTRSSILVRVGNTQIVIDTGPDFRQHMLREKVKSLDAIVFTHEHKDHIAGMDDVRGFNFIQGKAMEVYCTERVENALRREFAYIFDNSNYPGVPKINLNRIASDTFVIGEMQLTPIEVLHHKLPVLGFRIGNLVYITDANFISEEEKEKIKNTDVLILNALRHEKHISHFNLQEAIDLVNELKPKRAYFTHISHQLGLHSEVSKNLPNNVFLAYDGLSFSV